MAEGDSAPNLHAQWKTPVKPVTPVAEVASCLFAVGPSASGLGGLRRARSAALACEEGAATGSHGGGSAADGAPPRWRPAIPGPTAGMSWPRRATGTIAPAALGVRGRPGPPAGADAGTMPGDVPPI